MWTNVYGNNKRSSINFSLIQIAETITPRESSDDLGNNKENEDEPRTGVPDVDKNIQNVLPENVKGNENTPIVAVLADRGDDEGGGAVGGTLDDDSVFLNDALPSTSRNIDAVAQSPLHRLSIDNTPSIYIV